MKFSKASMMLALLGVGLAGRSASALTLEVLSMDPGSISPTVTYSSGLVSVSGNFNLTGVNGVLIPAADLTGVTITLTGFTPNGAAVSSATTVLQNLNGGTFTLTNSASQVILAGTAGSASLTAGFNTSSGGTNNAAGGVFNLGDVIYTPASGTNTLQPAINAAGFGNPGTFSFNLAGFDGNNPLVVGGVLQPFVAGVSGQVAETSGSGTPPGAPLPAAVWGGLGMMGALGGMGTMIRRRRR